MTIFSKKILSTFGKIYQLLKNLFGKKTKKSFASVINHITETFASEGLISSEEKKLFRNIVGFADKKINQQFRQKDKPTNVLSFANLNEIELQKKNINQVLGKSSFIALGDLLFAYQTIQKEAIQQNKTFQNHLTHLLVHGILHLLGYDHETAEMTKIMEEQEISILHTLNITNPYL